MYFKCGDENFTGFGTGYPPLGANQGYLTVSLQTPSGGATYNGLAKWTVTILDAKTQGAWVHDGAATGAAAAKRAEALKSDDANVSYSLQKTEANALDDDSNGVIDDEDYGPAGATGDFRFGVPAGVTMNVKLNQTAWAPGQGVTAGPADTDLALGATDLSAPSVPSNVVTTPGDGTVRLDWTGSTDGGDSGLAGYRIYRLMPGTYGDLTLQTAVPTLVGQVGAGTTTFTDGSLTNGTWYAYYVRAVDTATNASARSNEVSATPVAPPADTTAPAAVSDLAVAGVGTTSVDLTWTAPGDDGSVGTAAAYDLRYSTSPITDDVSFAAATQVSGVPAPKPAGGAEAFSVPGLTASTHYYFAVKTRDEVPNWSALSNVVDTTTLAPPSGTMLIDAGAACTATTSVTLDSNVSGATEMRFSNDDVAFSGWEPYAATKAWTLAAGADGQRTVYAEYRNAAATTIAASDEITLDTTPPSGSVAINGGATRTDSLGVMLTLSASDGAGSGVASMTISNDGIFDTEVPAAFASPCAWTLSAGADGSRTVWVVFTDAAGNVSVPAAYDTITLDTAPPGVVTDLAVSAVATHTVTLTWTAPGDDGTVGQAASYDLRYSTSPITEANFPAATSAGAFAPKPAGSAEATTVKSLTTGTRYYFALKAADGAGNVSALSNVVSATPVARPTGTVLVDAGAATAATTSVTLDSSVTGASDMRFSNDNVTFSGWEPYAATKAWTLAAGADGPRTVYAQYRNAAGTFATTDAITLDTTTHSVAPPSGTMRIDADAANTATASVTLDSNVVGASDMRFSNDNATFSGWEPYAATKAWRLAAGADGPRTVYAQYRNAAGTFATTDAITLITTSPSGSMLIDMGTAYVATASVTLDSNVVGASDMRFSNDNVTFSGWEPYAATKAWRLAAGADGSRTVYAQYRNTAWHDVRRLRWHHLGHEGAERDHGDRQRRVDHDHDRGVDRFDRDWRRSECGSRTTARTGRHGSPTPRRRRGSS